MCGSMPCLRCIAITGRTEEQRLIDATWPTKFNAECLSGFHWPVGGAGAGHACHGDHSLTLTATGVGETVSTTQTLSWIGWNRRGSCAMSGMLVWLQCRAFCIFRDLWGHSLRNVSRSATDAPGVSAPRPVPLELCCGGLDPTLLASGRPEHQGGFAESLLVRHFSAAMARLGVVRFVHRHVRQGAVHALWFPSTRRFWMRRGNAWRCSGNSCG